MDVFQDYILVTYSPFDVHIFHVMISGELSPASNPVLQVMFSMKNLQHHFLICREILSINRFFIHYEQLSTVRELSIMSPKSPPVSMRFIPEQNDKGVLEQDTNVSSDLLSQQPSRYFLP